MFISAGVCPIFQNETVFVSPDADLRNKLNCISCPGGSIPRERAIFAVMTKMFPRWKNLSIHESSPENRYVSNRLRDEYENYVATQFYPDVALGAMRDGFRCENLENQTFAREAFDIVISQDVMEHVFRPDRVCRDVFRTLKPGGAYLFTTPIFPIYPTSRPHARLREDGSIEHLIPEEYIEYHGNPIDLKGSLVTWHYGHDLADLISQWSDFRVEHVRLIDRRQGITGPLTDVMICIRDHVEKAVLP